MELYMGTLWESLLLRKKVETKGIHMVVLTTISPYYVYNIVYSIIRLRKKRMFLSC